METMTDTMTQPTEQLRGFTRALESNPNEDQGETTGSKMEISRLNFWYGKFQALTGIDLQISEHRITAIIGPSGCGKSTLIRTLNRMGDLIPNSRTEGKILLDGQNILASHVDVIDVRRRVGMVFQRPNPFPKSIYDNVAFGPRLYGVGNRGQLDEIVEQALRNAALWDEVKDKVQGSALALSGGQQQRLCIARALAVQPQVLLMDEPASALDPIATFKIEELMRSLREQFTIVIVTHNMQQAARVSDYTAFMMMNEKRSGTLVEFAPTAQIFTRPSDKRTEDYITGRFG
ncbi:MAG: phosphate ABC transporter ATP-binding protein [Chloroflexi bacterium]|nr:phosphate ABC transporter ATP-binding protein [Chloroflexota bacterium]